jgi:hypothetical protein
MSGAYAIARHEFVRRWPLVLVGFGLGLVALVSAGTESTESRLAEVLATISIVVCWIIAFTTGMQLIGRPLHDGRLSFYFTRPISSSGIAIGKIAGGLLAVICMHAAPMLAPLLTVPDPNSTSFGGAATFIGIAFFVVGLVAGILARSRSRWFVTDLVGAAVAALVAVLMFGGFGARKSEIALFITDHFEAQALIERADLFINALVVVAAVALLASVVVGITRGRTDRDLVHRSISLTLWPSLIAVGLVGVALAQWGLQ